VRVFTCKAMKLWKQMDQCSFEHPEHSVIGESEHSMVDYSFEHSENMAQPPPRERTQREMVAPDFTYESLCIQYSKGTK